MSNASLPQSAQGFAERWIFFGYSRGCGGWLQVGKFDAMARRRRGAKGIWEDDGVVGFGRLGCSPACGFPLSREWRATVAGAIFRARPPPARRLVGRGQLSRLLHRHFRLAAEDRARAGFRAEDHRPARFALVTSSELVGHLRVPPFDAGAERGRAARLSAAASPESADSRIAVCGYFLLIGSPQQWIFPCSEPRVTTNSAPHLPQKYRFPVSVAT